MCIDKQKVAVVIVTHDSGAVLPACISALKKQTRQPDRIIIVDSGSIDTLYLTSYGNDEQIDVILRDNMGFSAANNLGAATLSKSYTYLLFLNPDTFLDPDFIQKGIELFDEYDEAGVITGRMAGFDPVKMAATGLLDSTGIFRKWYGRWYDRGQGEVDDNCYNVPEFVPAICGALMLCRLEYLHGAVKGSDIFNPAFFMYKEDIELSLRLRKTGVKLLYHPELRAFHCRGWEAERSKIPFSKKILSASNELLLYRNHFSPYILWALFKYVLVRFFRV